MWVCLYCNGLKTIATSCPQCSAPMEDRGKVSDYYLDYSPYREIEDLKMTDGYEHDHEQHECMHYICCPACGHIQVQAFKEEDL